MTLHLTKPRARKGTRKKQLCHGGPYSGQHLALVTPGTLEFSVTKNEVRGVGFHLVKYQGYYNNDMRWISTL